ncbi:hypothetical protein ETB97_011977 [Aspergillus alliaceus]|uniref:Uncharacterized protein n=1 Tax=Petromyces alliaceus TaxID=209559 RepID=A0A8H6AFW1_PETAA|nr:hypothetical protein ETB97_011977 [Aspergillus burnettii]
MDITPKTFPFFLPRILDDIATCSFVSIDFEFSGIACPSAGPNSGKSTLQERYEEVKASANKYGIVQIGLTICHEDTETGTYILKPYNLYLSPIIDRRLDVGRDLCFQSSAVEFLLENKFCIHSVYKNGIHYLSREEEAIAMARAAEKYERTSVRKVIDVKETEHDSLAFLKAIRHLVNDWLARGEARESYLNIPPPRRTVYQVSGLPSALNNFQKRLVHQLIEVEYPALVTISKPAFIQVIDYDEEREKAIREQRMARVQERIWKQTGFRWVVEALAGGDLTPLDPFSFVGIMDSSTAVEPQTSLKDFSNKLKQRLKDHRPVLADVWPGIHHQHSKYNTQKIDHEAGYDSLLTAQIFIKLSAQLRDGGISQRPEPASELEEHRDPTGSYATIPALQENPKGTVEKSQLTKNEPKTSINKLGTRFDVLGVEEINHHIEGITLTPRKSSSSVDVSRKVANGELIPRQDAQFWKAYGNKLRVFGTEEKVCRMTSKGYVHPSTS